MPGIEESIRYDVSQAEAAMKALAARVEATREKTDDLRQGGQQLGAGLKGLEDGAGAAGSALGRLAGAADLLSPGLGSLVRTGADLADVLEVAGQAGAAGGVGLGSLLTVLGPIAALGAAAYLVLNDMSEGVERLRERADAAAPALEKMRQGIKNVAAAENDLAVQRGEVDGTMDFAQAALASAKKQAASNFQATREGAGELLEQASGRRTDAVTALRTAEEARAQAEANVARLERSGPRDDTGGRESAALERARADAQAAAARVEGQAAALADADAEVRQARTNLDELGKAEEDLAFRIAQTNLAKKAQAEAAKNVAGAAAEDTKAADGATAALDARAEAVRRATAQYQEAKDPLLAYQRALEEIAALEARGKLTATEAAEARSVAADKGAASARAAGEAEQRRLAAENMVEAELKRQQADQAAAKAAAQAAARAELNLDVFKSGVSGASSLMSGDAIGALSSGLSIAGALGVVGPYGMAAGAALGGVSTLGEQGADAIANSLKEQLGTLVSGIEEMPDLVAQLPDILQELAPALAGALVEAGPELAIALAKAQAEVLLGLPSMMGEAIYEAMARALQEGKDFLASPFGSDNSLGERLQNGAVDAGRVALGLATFGASEVVYGAANAASGGAIQEKLYAGDREQGRSRSGRDLQDRAATRAAWRADVRGQLGVDRDLVSTGLLTGVHRAEDRDANRVTPYRLR